MNHTKGNWKYRPDFTGKNFYIETVDQSHTNSFIGEIGGGLQSFFEIKANAKLVAAAPELLEALTEIIPFAKQWINENHPAMQKALDAIKKATE